MEIQNLFNNDAVSNIQTFLEKHCVDGRNITRNHLAAELQLLKHPVEGEVAEAKESRERYNTTVESIISSMVALEVLSGYTINKGAGGGIGKVGAAKPPKDKTIKTPPRVITNFPAGFLDGARDALEMLIPTNDFKTRVTRSKVAAAMGVPGSETETLLSHAIRQGEFPGVVTFRGVGGGVGRSNVTVEPTKTDSSGTTENTEKAADSTEEPSAPESLEAALTSDEPVFVVLEETEDDGASADTEVTLVAPVAPETTVEAATAETAAETVESAAAPENESSEAANSNAAEETSETPTTKRAGKKRNRR